MNAVGINVFKGKSTVAVLLHFDRLWLNHSILSTMTIISKKLLALLDHCQVKPKVVMEYTEKYYEPIDNALHNAGILVSMVNAILVLNTQKNKSAPCL